MTWRLCDGSKSIPISNVGVAASDITWSIKRHVYSEYFFQDVIIDSAERKDDLTRKVTITIYFRLMVSIERKTTGFYEIYQNNQSIRLRRSNRHFNLSLYGRARSAVWSNSIHHSALLEWAQDALLFPYIPVNLTLEPSVFVKPTFLCIWMWFL